ncbi:unnamed protein product [Didymodactylos carnosus]|uniref:Uncharacterized protein n=1 Tax=Didymodactylos carnosus TaxID=1234261 RepID=A0A814VST8_9BILA|nr:unnamed protein product [Didymodactylos carnosus]CAF1192450.1 unnamed protein product [Didymodactylos carnosus]CAF3707258.1 unnamed protein product [Didymodactylos carnosus]CAF3956690.1 unnamed protein product [Didymodactylos carnosus]
MGTHTIHRAIGHRDPLSFPRFETDETFNGKVQTQKHPYTTQTHEAHRDEPWNRLYSTATLSSGRHEIYTTDPKAPNDSLDFLLKTTYDQHQETFANKAKTCVQKETVSDDHGRILKNRIVYKAVVPPELNHPLRIAENERKEHIAEPKQAIRFLGGVWKPYNSRSA